MKNNPLVSILIPYYNDGAFLKEAIQSVLNSTYTDFELILLDHASTEQETVNIAHSFSDPRIKHIRMEKNLGAGSGLLLLEFLKHARGKYIKLFCADDIMMSDGLETLVDFMENNPDKDFAFGNMDYVDENGKPLNENWFHERQGFNINNTEIDELILFANGIGHLPFPSCICKKECFDHIEIEKIFMMIFDMTIWVRFLLNGYKIAFLNKSIVNYRIHSGQISSVCHNRKNEHISGFESIEYCRLFYNIKTISLLKKIFPTKYALSLKKNEESFIQFVVAHYYATSSVIPYQIFGKIELYKMLNNDEQRRKIEKRFNFGIKEFRIIYSQFSEIHNSDTYFKHIQNKPAKKLAILQILYILFYKLIHWPIITKIKRKRKKKYTV